jgi:hypothetical protein
VAPEVITSEGREWVGSITNEASGGVGVETKHEWNKKMMSVPECLKGLLADLRMCGRIHQEHAEKHHMPSNTSGLCIVDFDGGNLSDLGLLDIEETKRC